MVQRLKNILAEGSSDEMMRSYTKAFTDYGIDVDSLEPDEAAARIRGRRVSLQLVVYLNRLGDIRRKKKDPSWEPLVEIVRLVDPDALRMRLQIEEVVGYYQGIINNEPENTDAYLILIDMLQKKGDSAAAISVENALVDEVGLKGRRLIGDRAALRGQWETASGHFANLFNSPTSRHIVGIQFDYLRYAPSLVRQGDLKTYESVRQMALDQYSDTRFPTTQEYISRVCLLLPWQSEWPDAFDHWRKDLVAGYAGDSAAWRKPRSCLAIGLIEYRKDQWDQCIKWCEEGLASQNATKSKSAMILSLLAMSHHKLVQPDAARARLRQAALLIADARTKTGWKPTEAMDWFDWENAAILYDEATALVKPTPQPSGTDK